MPRAIVNCTPKYFDTPQCMCNVPIQRICLINDSKTQYRLLFVVLWAFEVYEELKETVPEMKQGRSGDLMLPFFPELMNRF